MKIQCPRGKVDETKSKEQMNILFKEVFEAWLTNSMKNISNAHRILANYLAFQEYKKNDVLPKLKSCPKILDHDAEAVSEKLLLSFFCNENNIKDTDMKYEIKRVIKLAINNHLLGKRLRFKKRLHHVDILSQSKRRAVASFEEKLVMVTVKPPPPTPYKLGDIVKVKSKKMLNSSWL